METPVTSLGTRSGVHWMRRNERSSERATARASVVFPTPGTSSSRTWPSTRSAARSCSVASRFPTTTVPTWVARRSAAPRTLWITLKLCGLEGRDGGLLGFGAAPDRPRGDKRERQARERAEGVEGEHDGILLAQRERAERSLDEEDERDHDERAQGELPPVDRARRDHERDRGEEIDDPPGGVGRGRPLLSARHVALVQAVGDEHERERDGHAADHPRVLHGDRADRA